VTVGLLAIMLDEEQYVDRWARAVSRIPVPFDRVVVVEGGSSDGTAERLRASDVPFIVEPFSGHFADQRNRGVEHLGTDWVLELDADEIPSTPLLAGLRDFIRDAEAAEMDCIGIPRLNFIDGALVAGPGHKNLDYQYRLHNRRCHWRGAVHEELTGYRHRYELGSLADGHFIIHDKTSKRHEARNAMYRTLTP
jgi:glycosyltransferase involved in cell wall biosynthesis